MKQLILKKWQSMPTRDRKTLALLGVSISILFIYTYIWLPSIEARARLSQEVLEKKSQLAQMQRQASQIQTLNTAIHLSHSGVAGLQTAVNASAKLHHLAEEIDSIKLIEQGGIHISLPSIRFEEWAKWVFALQTEHKIRITSARIQALRPGLVHIEADLVTAE